LELGAGPTAEAPEPPAQELDRLRVTLGSLLPGRAVDLVLTENRSQIAAVRARGSNAATLSLRLDRSFLAAPTRVLEALGRWLLGRPRERQRALQTLREFFDEAWRGRARQPRPARRPVLRPVGQHFDLAELAAELDAHYFGGALRPAVTWGRRVGGSSKRGSIRLGSYDYRAQVVRIHPALDHDTVPRWVVESVLFHEMLHAASPVPEVRRGRRCIHPPEFRVAERSFRDHERARAWLDANLGELLRR
jgi:hypothetical protein